MPYLFYCSYPFWLHCGNWAPTTLNWPLSKKRNWSPKIWSWSCNNGHDRASSSMGYVYKIECKFFLMELAECHFMTLKELVIWLPLSQYIYFWLLNKIWFCVEPQSSAPAFAFLFKCIVLPCPLHWTKFTRWILCHNKIKLRSQNWLVALDFSKGETHCVVAFTTYCPTISLTLNQNLLDCLEGLRN